MKNYDDFRILQTDYDLKFTFVNQTVSFFKIMPFLNSLFSSFTEKAASKSSIFIYENEFPIVCEPKIAKHCPLLGRTRLNPTLYFIRHMLNIVKYPEYNRLFHKLYSLNYIYFLGQLKVIQGQFSSILPSLVAGGGPYFC